MVITVDWVGNDEFADPNSQLKERFQQKKKKFLFIIVRVFMEG